MFENLLDRFLSYVKIDTRSDSGSSSIPSTRSQVDFAMTLLKELEDLGLEDCKYHEESGFVTASLGANTEDDLATIGFIAHMDTADFNSENIRPRIFKDYNGQDILYLDEAGEYSLDPKIFPNLRNYRGKTLITTSGDTLLGGDDKAGIAEIITAVEYLIKNPSIKRGTLKLAFGPDEEIGRGADNFDVGDFGADFAYTVDGGPIGNLQYENFNAARARVNFKGLSVHPGSGKDRLVNSIKLAMDYHRALPEDQVPEKTQAREGFFMLTNIAGNIDGTELSYIIRDHSREKFEARKKALVYLKNRFNKELDGDFIELKIEDQYYNMREIIEGDMYPVELAERAMLRLDIEPIMDPIRGGTDGAKLSFMGLPCPNLFTGGENFHGRYEFIALESMEKAVETIIEIVKLNASPM